MRRPVLTLRLRLILMLVGLSGAGLVVVDVVTHALLREYLVDRVDQQLSLARITTGGILRMGGSGIFNGGGLPMLGHPHHRGSALLPPGTYGELRSSSGRTLDSVTFAYGTDEGGRPDLPRDLGAIAREGGGVALLTVGGLGDVHSSYRVLVTQVRGLNAHLIVAIPLTEVDETLARVMWIEVIVTLAALTALGVTAWWIVRRELRPLDRMAATAGEIAAGDLSQRVEPADGATEVGRLGLALNEMLSQIERAFAAQEASEQRLRRFLADASHELRTPLTSIRGYAELFRRGAGERPEDLALSMRRIEDEARRMGVLVDDLLLLARLDADRPLAHEDVDLGALVAECVRDAEAAYASQRIALKAPQSLRLVGDADRLRQVVMNLLTNAVRHTPPGTEVEVELSVDDGGPDATTPWVVLTVRDHGEGLPADQLDKVFEPFYRVDTGRDRDSGGSGLGLAIVKTVVEAHGGSVVAACGPNAGATFTVRLPLRNGRPHGTAGDVSSEPRTSPPSS